MRCPACNGDTTVVDSRLVPDGQRRRRECTACGERFTTRETTVAPRAPVAPPRRKSARPPADPREKRRRERLRRDARAEAAETGEDVAAIYARWGCA